MITSWQAIPRHPCALARGRAASCRRRWGMPLDTSKPLQQVGNYDLLAKIAEGGMGTVYKGRHRDTGDIVAIKIIPPTAARNSTLLRRFEQEFTAAHTLDHPNVVKAIEYCGLGPSPFLVMEFV